MSLGGHIGPCESKPRSETELLNVCPGSTFMLYNFSAISNVDLGPHKVCMPRNLDLYESLDAETALTF